ncbi:MAG: CpaF family protein [Candidatus Omnitrophica bacterium]|nr:CpaF family protein [Candidatus Omnitrophota bacterium]
MLKKLKDKIKEKLISKYSGLLSRETINLEELKEVVRQIINDTIYQGHINLSEKDKSVILGDVIDDITGLGPLESFMKDPHVTEIMINGLKKVYIEKQGTTELTDVAFEDEGEIRYIISKMLAPTRRRVDESYPYAEVSLKDGSRVNIVIPPIALGGPAVTIRRFLKDLGSAEDLIKLGTLDRRMADFLIASIKAKVNIVFSGATGAGKTTTLNVFSSYIPAGERIITIEDTAELSLRQEHVVRLESRQPSIEGKGEITIRDLFKNSLRMRPDRIILGEIRGAEALDLLQAICSGHGGSLSVIHAESPQEVVDRLETMISISSTPIRIETIHRQIARTINLIVHQEQLLDGSRKVTRLSQVSGLKDGQVVIEDIFVYHLESFDEQGKAKGNWKATGVVPNFLGRFKKTGVNLSEEIFRE